MRGRVSGSEGLDVGRRGDGNAAIDTAAGWTAGTAFPSGWKARHKGAPHMRHSSAVVENLRFRLDERAGCRGGSKLPRIDPTPVRRDMEAALWAVFRVSGPRCSSLNERRPRLRERPSIRPRNGAAGQSDSGRKTQGFSEIE